MNPAFKSYNNDDFPVTSFVYALHCDVEYGNSVYTQFQVDRNDTTPLSPYTSGKKRAFPAEAIRLVYQEVPAKMPPAAHRYNPTGGDAAKIFVRHMLPELTYQAPAGEAAPVPPPNPAFYNSERPLLSCLGLIFLNGDVSFDPLSKIPQISNEVAATLKLVRRAPNGRPFLSRDDALILLPAFVDELTLGEAAW